MTKITNGDIHKKRVHSKKKSTMRTYVLIVFILLFYMNCAAQANTLSAGGDCTGTGGTASYSVGQLDYIAIDVAAGSAYLGVQQPYELFETNSLDENDQFSLSIGPNPVSGQLIVHSSLTLPIQTYFTLHDEAGKVLSTHPIVSEHSSIDMSSYAAGMYFLNIISAEKTINTFKIIKH
jgi:hypothetical protein